MSLAATERQLNLLFVLLNTTRPIEREEIRRRVPGYEGKSNEAFERQFERDKEALRQLNIPVENKYLDVLHEDASGYLINKENWLLPDIKLTTSERALLSLAASAWADVQIGDAVSAVSRQFSADTDSESRLTVDLNTRSAQIVTFLSAKSVGKCVTFLYLSSQASEPELRNVAPWRILLRRGAGYLIGFDHDRGEQRIFKLERIVDQVKISEESILEHAPADLDVNQILDKWDDFEERLPKATIEVHIGKGGSLRNLASSIDFGESSDVLTFTQVAKEKLITEIARNCDQVRIVEPVSLVEAVELHFKQVSAG